MSARDLALQGKIRAHTRSGVIADAKLDRIEDAVRDVGGSGPWRCDHGHLIDAKGNLLAEPAPGGSRAMRAAKYASPDTLGELLRGYRLAKEAGLLGPVLPDRDMRARVTEILRDAVTINRQVQTLFDNFDITHRGSAVTNGERE